MNYKLFIVLIAGCLAGKPVATIAQTNVNLERFEENQNQKKKLKFIEGIEISQSKISNDIAYVNTENIVKVKPAVIVKPAKLVVETAIEKCSPLQFKYATMLDREVESISNINLYNYIDEWWDTRYRYGGSTKSGIDCSAFAGQLIQSVYNLEIPRTAREQYQFCDKVAIEELQEGDLVFFNTRGGVSHVGVYLGDHYFVHSSTSSGVTISSLTEVYYAQKFICGGKIVTR